MIWLLNLFYSKVVGHWLPARWFGPPVPGLAQLSDTPAPPHLEIVSHCWRYSHLLAYQLSSLLNHPPARLTLTYTLFYCPDDTDTVDLIVAMEPLAPPGVTWNWQALPKDELFRRAIGRNQAALTSTADWLWFSDCDLIFHRNCLDSLADQLVGRRAGMVFPASEQITEMLPPDHPWLHPTLPAGLPLDIDPALFSINPIIKAKGAFQIVHGDVARAAGYCRDIALYQRPTEHWRKTFEDTAFRNLIGYQGEPVPVTGLHRIRHVAKGRYRRGSALGAAMGAVRSRMRQRADSRESAEQHDTDLP